jgi:predicted nucleic acid-binding protein
MTADVFLDANILLYANSKASQDSEKSRIAQQIMLAAPFALSTQVLQEFIANALRKKALGITEANIDATLELASHVPVVSVTLEIVITAVSLRRRYPVSHWDATIIAAAQALGCKTLYTEDMNHGQDYGGVRVLNHFL